MLSFTRRLALLQGASLNIIRKNSSLKHGLLIKPRHSYQTYFECTCPHLPTESKVCVVSDFYGNSNCIQWSTQFRSYHIMRRLVCIQNTLISDRRMNIRLKKKISGPANDELTDEEDDDDDDFDSDEDDLDSVSEFPEDRVLPGNFKEIQVHLKSLRLDAVVAAGLNMGRNRVEELFLQSKLLINGERSTKKARQCQPGDYIDLITGVEEGTTKFKRVRVLKVAAQSSDKGKKIVYLRAWKSNISKE